MFTPADLREFDNSEETARLRRSYYYSRKFARSCRVGDKDHRQLMKAEKALLAHVDASLVGLETSKLTGDARERALERFGAYFDAESSRD